MMFAQPDLVPLAFLSTFLAGSLWALLLGIQHDLAHRVDGDQEQARWLVQLFHLTFPPMAFIGGMLVDRLGVEWVLVGGFMIAALAIGLLAFREGHAIAVATVLMLGGAGGAVLPASMVLAGMVLFPERPLASMGLAMVVTSLGVLTVPWMVEPVREKLGFQSGLALLAIACLAPVLLLALNPPVHSFGGVGDALTSPVLLLAGLTVLLIAPVETVVRTWAGPTLERLGASRAAASRWVAAYWIAYLGSRAAMAPLAIRGPVTIGWEVWLIFGLILLTAVALGNLAGATGRVRAGWGLLLVGLALGPVLPLLAGVLLRKFSADPGGSLGALFALGSLGSLTLVPFLERFAQERTGFRMPMMVTLVAAIAALALALLGR